MTSSALTLPARRGISRRQALGILAASAALPLGVMGLRLVGPAAAFHEWHGEALGGAASMRLWHANPGHARRTLTHMAAEIARLEAVFSLYRADSELSRLNAEGRLAGASRDLIAVIEAAREVSAASGGAFDPTVQPLWTLYETHFRRAGGPGSGPAAADITATLRLVGHERLEIAGRSVRLSSPGMALTLNGIAQGYITDVVADLLRNEGFEHVVVAVGETRVLGAHPEGRPWQIALRDMAGATDRSIALTDEASATSGGYGTVFDPTGNHHHIFDPATGASASRLAEAVVTAPRAMAADALATALCVAGEARAAAILATSPGARAMLTRPDGSVVHVTPRSA